MKQSKREHEKGGDKGTKKQRNKKIKKQCKMETWGFGDTKDKKAEPPPGPVMVLLLA